MNINLTKALEAIEVAKEATPKLAELRKATQNFESIFVKKLLSQMQESIKEVHFGDKIGSDTYKDMMNQTLADTMASTGAFGVGNILYKSYAPKVLAMIEMDRSHRTPQQKSLLQKEGGSKAASEINP